MLGRLIYHLVVHLIYGRDDAMARAIERAETALDARDSALRTCQRIARLMPGCSAELEKHIAGWDTTDAEAAIIDRFRNDELAQLTLLPINVEAAHDDHRHAVELDSDATDYKTMRFYGPTFLEALELAAAHQDAHDERVRNKL